MIICVENADIRGLFFHRQRCPLEASLWAVHARSLSKTVTSAVLSLLSKVAVHAGSGHRASLGLAALY